MTRMTQISLRHSRLTSSFFELDEKAQLRITSERLPAHRIDCQQRHEGRERMRSRFPQGRNIFTDHLCSTHIDQSTSCLALVRFEFVLVRDGIEIFDDALAERGVLSHIKK